LIYKGCSAKHPLGGITLASKQTFFDGVHKVGQLKRGCQHADMTVGMGTSATHTSPAARSSAPCDPLDAGKSSATPYAGAQKKERLNDAEAIAEAVQRHND